ncbi:MAG: protein kinase [Actinomycetia bacterium]|nr:protein kinase [Actinomycetes bacterium]
MLVIVLEIGSTLAGYRIERVIGTGHVGTVYLARSPDLPRFDAVKVADPALMDDLELRDRFVREADVGARLNHPNIVAIHRRGTDDGLLWIAMQYVEGPDASTALQKGAMAPERAVHIITEIARAVDYAHSQRIIHRDIKPANFLLSTDGHTLLGDFGTAHILGQPTSTNGSVLATLPYAAPEVLSGKPIDGQADIYSLGCSLFRLLTGRTPFSAEGDAAAVIARHLRDPPPRVSDCVPELSAMDAVIARALAKDPRDRFDSAQALARAAAAALQQPTTPETAAADSSAPPTELDEPTPSPPRQPAEDDHPTPLASHFAAAATTVSGRLATARSTLASRWNSHERGRIVRMGGAAVAAVVIVLVTAVWLISSPSDDSTGNAPSSDTATHADPAQESSSPSTPLPGPAAQARLVAALPPGYPPDSCKPMAASGAAVAALRCSITVGPAVGPGTVTHELMPSLGAVDTAFTSVVDRTRVLNCPGGIQSPGPWRNKAAPELFRGTVMCGLQQGRPVVAWTTTDGALVVSAVRSASAEMSLDDLFIWWGHHS